jgi:hypothetical protein
MAKHIYLNFEDNRVVLISLRMSDEHLSVYSKKFDIDLTVLLELRDVTKAKSVYLNLDNEYVIGYKDMSGDLLICSPYRQFVDQKFKRNFLFSMKPLGTPKIPKPKKENIEEKQIQNKIENVVPKEPIIENVAPKEPIILDTDIILDKISKYGIQSISKEEKDFLDNLFK